MSGAGCSIWPVSGGGEIQFSPTAADPRCFDVQHAGRLGGSFGWIAGSLPLADAEVAAGAWLRRYGLRRCGRVAAAEGGRG